MYKKKKESILRLFSRSKIFYCVQKNKHPAACCLGCFHYSITFRAMCPSANAPEPDISQHCSDEELFVSLKKLVCGGPLPRNVVPDINPYDYKPENLPGKKSLFVF